jgi:hypothetical protein
MAASCFSTPLSARPVSPALSLRSGVRAVRPGLGQVAPAVGPLVLGLVLAAALLAPEQPVAQEGICQRHNGVAACRVW